MDWSGVDFCCIHRMAQLLVQSEADVTKEDQWKRTPLHWAARNGHVECVRVCVENECSLCVDVCC